MEESNIENGQYFYNRLIKPAWDIFSFTEPVLVYCWASMVDDVPKLNQHWLEMWIAVNSMWTKISWFHRIMKFHPTFTPSLKWVKIKGWHERKLGLVRGDSKHVGGPERRVKICTGGSALTANIKTLGRESSREVTTLSVWIEEEGTRTECLRKYGVGKGGVKKWWIVTY